MSFASEFPWATRAPLLKDIAEALATYRVAEDELQAAKAEGDRKKAIDAGEKSIRAQRRMGELLLEARRLKDEWIANARREFVPSPREACAVCGRFREVTHAHHVVPLSAQYDRSFDAPDHEHVWLCPTHHAIVHLILLARGSTEESGKALAGIIAELSEEEYQIVMRLLGLAGRSA